MKGGWKDLGIGNEEATALAEALPGSHVSSLNLYGMLLYGPEAWKAVFVDKEDHGC